MTNAKTVDELGQRLLIGTGAMSLHCHPQHPHLLAVGCWDGSVLVFDVRKKEASALTYSSSATAGRHRRPVWAVVWQQEQHGSPLAFHSMSSDGRLLLWTLAAAELRCQVGCSAFAQISCSPTEAYLRGFLMTKQVIRGLYTSCCAVL